MLILINKKATPDQIKNASEDLNGYIKIDVDIELEILTAGGEWHYEGEQLLLKQGSKQENIWGGGIDWESKEIDYNSMINMRPNQDNPSRDILSPKIRKKFSEIIKNILL